MVEKTSVVKEPRNEQSCGTKHLFYGFIQSMVSSHSGHDDIIWTYLQSMVPSQSRHYLL